MNPYFIGMVGKLERKRTKPPQRVILLPAYLLSLHIEGTGGCSKLSIPTKAGSIKSPIGEQNLYNFSDPSRYI